MILQLFGRFYLFKKIAVLILRKPLTIPFWWSAGEADQDSSDLSRFARVRTWAFLVNVRLTIIFAMEGLSQYT